MNADQTLKEYEITTPKYHVKTCRLELSPFGEPVDIILKTIRLVIVKFET